MTTKKTWRHAAASFEKLVLITEADAQAFERASAKRDMAAATRALARMEASVEALHKFNVRRSRALKRYTAANPIDEAALRAGVAEEAEARQRN